MRNPLGSGEPHGLRRRQRGTVTVEKLIMIGLIVVPLVALLIVFRKNVTDWYRNTVGELFQASSDADNSDEEFELGD